MPATTKTELVVPADIKPFLLTGFHWLFWL